MDTRTVTDSDIEKYSGLVFVHAMRMSDVAEDVEEVVQFYRVKVWRALQAYDPPRHPRRPGEDLAEAEARFVFMCLKNAEKDVLKRRRRNESYIEDMASTKRVGQDMSGRDRFEARYLSADHDEVYASVESEELVIPSTLTKIERSIVALLYVDYRLVEIQRQLGVTRAVMDRHMRAIRQKLADWKPSCTHPHFDPDGDAAQGNSGLQSEVQLASDPKKGREGTGREREGSAVDPLPAAA